MGRDVVCLHLYLVANGIKLLFKSPNMMTTLCPNFWFLNVWGYHQPTSSCYFIYWGNTFGFTRIISWHHIWIQNSHFHFINYKTTFWLRESKIIYSLTYPSIGSSVVKLSMAKPLSYYLVYINWTLMFSL